MIHVMLSMLLLAADPTPDSIFDKPGQFRAVAPGQASVAWGKKDYLAVAGNSGAPPIALGAQLLKGTTSLTRQAMLVKALEPEKVLSDVNAVAFSPDGEKLAMASKDGIVRIWLESDKRSTEAAKAQAASGPPKLEPDVLCSLRAPAKALSWCPDSRRLAVSLGESGAIEFFWLRDTAGSYELVHYATAKQGAISALCWTDELSPRLLAADSSGAVLLWTAEVKPEEALAGPVRYSAKDCDKAAHYVRFSDAAGQTEQVPELPRALLCDTKGRRMFVAVASRIEVLDRRDAERSVLLAHGASSSHAADVLGMCLGQGRLFSFGGDLTLSCWDVQTKALLGKLSQEELDKEISSMSVSSDGKFIAVMNTAGFLKVYPLKR